MNCPILKVVTYSADIFGATVHSETAPIRGIRSWRVNGSLPVAAVALKR
jgi:hypothetical protein